MIFLNSHFTKNERYRINCTEYPYDGNRFSESILPKVFYPNGVKSEKYLLKSFACEETGKTVKKVPK